MVTVFDFYADWCGPCQTQHEIMDELSLPEDVTVRRVDIDEETELANEHSVRSIPTIVVEGDDGTIDGRFIGLTAEEEIEEAVESAQK